MLNSLILPTGKYLGDIVLKLPANKIYYKYLTGCGASDLEIFCDRWSILVEPYIPVILGKQWMEKRDENGIRIHDANGKPIIIRNPEVLAVYERTSEEDIIDFLSLPLKKYKLITTPEGMRKIMSACQKLEINPYEKFYLLVDECEKLIQDANFREDITVVMDYFFLFKERAFISATPIPPSDPRFKEYNFEDFFIIPEEKTLINIDLYASNNIASTIKKYFNTHKNDNYLIFINSTERISSIIKFLKIENESQVFCSKESADILKISGVPNVAEHWHKDKFKRYNFFTSRFFTAFDLKVDCKPNVLIISDFRKVAHSALDPNTDVIQIAGRARNGINHLAHITNWEAKATKLEGEIRAYIDGLKDGYKMIEQLRDQCTNNQNIGTYDVLNEALNVSKYNHYINKRTGDQCPYLIDNEIQSNKLISFYKTPREILKAYEDTNRFNVKYEKDEYNLADENLETLKKGISRKETLRIICEMFATYFEQEKEVYSLSPNYSLTQLIKNHNELYQYYKIVGIERIRELNYNVTQIVKEFNMKKLEQSDGYYTLTYTLLLIFKEGKCFTGAKIRGILTHYLTKFKIRLPTTIKQLRSWFDIPDARVTLGYNADGKEVKGYMIGKPKNSIALPKTFRQ